VFTRGGNNLGFGYSDREVRANHMTTTHEGDAEGSSATCVIPVCTHSL
jgi:hypothetical protein